MLLFSTILNTEASMRPDDFIRLVLAWNAESSYEENRVKGVDWHGEHTIRFGDPKLWLEFIESPDGSIIAARHEKITEDGVVWDSDFVANFDESRISIRLDRTYSEDALAIDAAFSTPHFISLLVRQGYLQDDKALPVLRTAIPFSDGQANLIRELVSGEGGYQLPVVLVFKASDGSEPLEVKWLASRLKGAAHVLVEEAPGLCSGIRALCGNSADTFGGIRIFFPSWPVREKKITYRTAGADMKKRLERVVQHVIKYSLAQRIDHRYTWQGVSGSVLNAQLESQIEGRKIAENARRKAEDEVERVYEAFDEDLNQLQDKVAELTRANEALQYENQGLRAKYAAAESIPLIYMGEEEDLYEGEIRDTVLTALSEFLNSSEKATRRADVISDILDNNEYQHLSEERKQRIKALFKGYKNLTGVMRQELQSMGFEITEAGKHYKITLRGDPRYMVTIGKTPSDNRSGANNAALISKKML